MKYLVTGGAGFIGSHLAEVLIQSGHKVIILDNLSTGNINNIENIIGNDNLEFINDSILNFNLVKNLIAQVDGVFHLAAALGVKKILEKPLESLQTNIHGSENVIHAAASSQVKLFLASTSEVYGKNMNQPLSEDSDRVLGSPLLTRWAYSECKAIDETLVQIYHDLSGLNFVIGRFFNTTGPRQSGAYGMVLPKFVTSALLNEPLEVFGSGTQRRVFCHVEDAVNAIIKLFFNDQATCEVFNIGGEEEVSISELAKKVIEETNSKSKIRNIPYSEAYPNGFEDSMRRNPNTNKIRQYTDWAPKFSLRDTIQDIVKFMKN